MNAAVDPALLQLVQQHVNALKIDLDKMAFESEGGRKVVKEAVEEIKADLDQLDKRVSSTEQSVKHLQSEHGALTESVESLKLDVEQRLAKVVERMSSAIPQISCGNKIFAVKCLVQVLCSYWHTPIGIYCCSLGYGKSAMETEQHMNSRYSILP